jgi:hypothetical protein
VPTGKVCVIDGEFGKLEQIMFVRINDINKKLDVLIKKVGAEKK